MTARRLAATLSASETECKSEDLRQDIYHEEAVRQRSEYQAQTKTAAEGGLVQRTFLVLLTSVVSF